MSLPLLLASSALLLTPESNPPLHVAAKVEGEPWALGRRQCLFAPERLSNLRILFLERSPPVI